MECSFSVLALVFFICGFLEFGLAAIIWSHRPGPGIVPLTILLCTMAFWVIIYGLESSIASLSVVVLMGKLEYLAAVSTGVIWLCFTLDYTGSAWWKRPRNLGLVGIISLLVLVLTWTNEIHGLIWSDIFLEAGSFGLHPVWVPGPLYYLDPLYQYFLYLVGIVVLIRFAIKKPSKHRKPIYLLLIGTVIPIIGSILYVFRFLQPGGHDIFPLYLFVSTIIYSITILRYHLVDIIPVAYEKLIKDIPEGILVLDSSNDIKEINPAGEKMLNVNKSVARDHPLAEIYPQLSGYLNTTQDIRDMSFNHSMNGVPVYLDISVVILRNKRDQVSGKLVELKDVTELKNAQKKLEELFNQERGLRSELEEEVQKRNQFSRAIVHELRTPLTAIMASNELLEDVVKDKIAVSLVKNIGRSSHNLEQRVNELFELARGESGLIKVNLVDLDLEEVIRETVSELQPVAAEKKLSLLAELPGTGLPVLGDRGRLSQVLNNLISNSFKFTSRGGIVVRARPINAEQVRVQVEDSGRGMAPDQMENLFDPYRRQDREKSGTLGLGIGLALSKIFIELHHGKIEADSTPGKGATVSFTIPLRKPPQD
ncbi:MAG: hypothetical protein JXA46_06150 [Dehalococcoidales bacterium]|nr:hypothetical protein [Dehalococcoidales bacterium]